MPPPRRLTPVRLSRTAVEEVDQIAAETGSTRSAILRDLLRLGLISYRAGKR